MTGADLVTEARSWTGTKFVHGGRVKGWAADCVGLILGSLRELGVTDWQPPGYTPLIDPGELERYLLQFCVSCGTDRQPAAGDILLFSFAGQAIHLGLYSGQGSLIHSWEKAGRVVEHDYDEFWRQHTVGVYRWKATSGG